MPGRQHCELRPPPAAAAIAAAPYIAPGVKEVGVYDGRDAPPRNAEEFVGERQQPGSLGGDSVCRSAQPPTVRDGGGAVGVGGAQEQGGGRGGGGDLAVQIVRQESGGAAELRDAAPGSTMGRLRRSISLWMGFADELGDGVQAAGANAGDPLVGRPQEAEEGQKDVADLRCGEGRGGEK